jgi:hypothetical protein
MAGMQTVETQGTRFFWSASSSLSTAQEILGVKTASGFGGTSPVIDVSDVLSTAREKRIGLRDAGEVTLGINYNPSTAVSPGLLAMEVDAGTRVKRKLAIKFSTIDALGIGKKVDAYCGGLTIDMTEDSVWSGSAQIVLASGASYTTFAT